MKLDFDVKTDSEIVFRGHTVMSEAERLYLQALIELLTKKNIVSVLEIGFGLGISSGLIQQILQPAMHHIVELEQSILDDCRKFCSRHAGAEAVKGDYSKIGYTQQYDLLFFDPYDYELALNSVTERESYTREFNREVILAQKVLHPGGYLCHVFFGDCPAPELSGFTLHDFGLFAGARMVTGQEKACTLARLGYYVRD